MVDWTEKMVDWTEKMSIGLRKWSIGLRKWSIGLRKWSIGPMRYLLRQNLDGIRMFHVPQVNTVHRENRVSHIEGATPVGGLLVVDLRD